MEKKSFIFYTSWKKNIEMMEDDELRRFINNLINHTEGNGVELPTRMEKMVWNDLVEVLNHNERKRERAAERSRKNGQSGGRPSKPNETHNNPIGSNETQQDIEEPDGINNNLNNLLMGNGKLLMENGKGEMDNGQVSMVNDEIGNKIIGIMKQVIDDGYVQEEEVKNWKIKDTRDILNDTFPDYPKWETDFNNLGLDGFIRLVPIKSKTEFNYITYSTLKAHSIL